MHRLLLLHCCTSSEIDSLATTTKEDLEQVENVTAVIAAAGQGLPRLNSFARGRNWFSER